MKRFILKMAFQKMNFPWYFQKVIFVRGTYFVTKKTFLKKPNTLEYAQVFMVTCPKLNFVAALLSAPPKSCLLFKCFMNTFVIKP